METNIIVPEVYAGMVTEKVKGLVKISNYAKDLGELDNFAQEGDSITFPQFCALGEAEILERGGKIKVEELRQNSTKKTIKHYSKGVLVYDIDALTGKGNFLENAVMQQARIFARARDKETVADILANTVNKFATANADAITEKELHGAFALWGDEQDTDSFDAIIVNSRLLPSFYDMKGFVSTDVTYSKNNNGIIRNGVVGLFRGVPVVLSDVGTYDTTKNECITFILKKGALGFKDKKDGIDIELKREGEDKATKVLADEIFIIGLIQKDGVTVVRKTIA
ncbi:hypothetical protein [Clostridium weizhouense]|uniref:Phage major capsid protein n=1 Tax=Clostridium weizhouense TaxID=2859781 RepID=A0ABS7AQL9_9CLOT|nr:hypothetical protein [Clostridium weizhouense]MBW6410963.1 hypothetical protein [Clostridium weizhouense]